jgi:hypothetical protein
MPEDEVYPGHEGIYSAGRITTIAERGVQGWTWADHPARFRQWAPWKPGERRWTTTRADWLFAYWLARAAGHLRPLVGPGADPTASRIEPRLPPWRAAPPPSDD